jgi:hypothetical protein
MIRRELRIYKTRPLADVAIMSFYGENKANIKHVYSAYKSRGVLMKDGTKIYFKHPKEIIMSKTSQFNEITFY